jgi:N-acetylneuraminic acid mutarotase
LPIFTVFNSALVNAEENQPSWKSMSSMPTPRGGFGVAVVGGRIYAIGGLNENNSPLSVTEEYNPQKNEWVTKTPMPTPRSGFAIAVYQNKIYVIGGTVGSGYIGNNEVYDPATNKWQTKASMPTPRADLSASVSDDKMYLIGGKRYASTTPFFVETDINEAYDPVTDTWATKTSVPTGVQGYASAVIGSKVYIMGGSRQPSSMGNTVIVNNNQVYDTQKDNWTLAASLPRTNSYGAAAVTEDFMAPQKIYHLGGYSGGQFSGRVDVYDPNKNVWTSTDSMPTPRAYLSLAVINDVLYAIGGFDGLNWLGTIEEFTPPEYGTIPPIIQILSPENRTYSEVVIHFTVNRPVQWAGYSIDNKANITLNSQIKISDLSHGTHRITIYANDSKGNMGSSKTVFFSVDILPPKINIVLPQNVSYGFTDIQLIFIVDENVTAIEYSLNGQPKEPIAGNVTLAALSNGSYELIVYATDHFGNSGEESVFFEISQFPIISVIATLAIVIIIVSSAFIIIKRNNLSNDKSK